MGLSESCWLEEADVPLVETQSVTILALGAESASLTRKRNFASIARGSSYPHDPHYYRANARLNGEQLDPDWEGPRIWRASQKESAASRPQSHHALLPWARKSSRVKGVRTSAPRTPVTSPSTAQKEGTFEHLFDNSDPVDPSKYSEHIFEDDSKYCGEWMELKLQDANGKEDDGTWVRQGRGSQVWSDGSCYEGEWQKGRMHGKGRYLGPQGEIFVGEWREDMAHGHGVYTQPSHCGARFSRYEGQWAQDRQHGRGTESWNDGSTYTGLWKQGHKDGSGLFSWADGSRYEGAFRDGEMHGEGVYFWNDGRSYNGQWKAGRMHGDGVHEWPDGRRYQGAYKDDQRSGFGTFAWADGRIYKGEWQEGKQHGQGSCQWPDGQVFEGTWEQGKQLGT
eukprot:gnl/TRDRNA2_/TRDRNA2_184574_c0_seq1.p1 gnl/TRDRNA2_/TRDRNA2_184574_c0~~gnl/TRDRNA2_/TRDRNA2_184574_c0_seq1.p1  ORF type:complete len:420 (+),score=58.98 gnl/TRDRNA2_/TRDRNA2_184574_c0_seq1:79-1260(+)